MHSSDLYRQWLEERRQVLPPADFVEVAMTRVTAHELGRQTRSSGVPLIQRLVRWISEHPLAQAACLGAGVTAGALRLSALLQFLLSY